MASDTRSPSIGRVAHALVRLGILWLGSGGLGCGSGGPNQPALFAYVVNRGSDSITGFKIDGARDVSPIPGSPFATGSGPQGLTFDPRGRLAYVLSSGLTLDPGGGLTYVPGSGSRGISIHRIDPRSGTLAPLTFVDTSYPPSAIQFVSNFAYVSLDEKSFGFLRGYRVDSATGLPAALSQPDVFAGAYAIVDPLGRFFYSAGGRVPAPPYFSPFLGFLIDHSAGTLAPIRLPDVGTGPFVVDPQGRFLVALWPYRELRTYSIDPATGSLTLAGARPDLPQTSAESANGMVFDAGGRFLYIARVTAREALTVVAYSLDPTTGALTESSRADFVHPSFDRLVLQKIIMSPTGRSLYVRTQTVTAGYDPIDTEVVAFSINPTRGALAAGAAFHVRVDQNPAADDCPFPGGDDMTLDNTGSLLFVGNSPCGSGIEILRVDNTTGTLQPLVGSPFLTGPGADWVKLYRATP